jgi:hypothetical protein
MSGKLPDEELENALLAIGGVHAVDLTGEPITVYVAPYDDLVRKKVTAIARTLAPRRALEFIETDEFKAL